MMNNDYSRDERIYTRIDQDGCWSPPESLDWNAGTLLTRLRLMRGWTQRELAEKAGIGQSHVAKAEAGKDMRLSTAKKLIEALGCRLSLRARPVAPFPAR